MIKLIKRLTGALTLLLVLVSCKISPPISVDYDTQYNFANLKSYAWIKAKDSNKVKTLDGKRQAAAIETILNRKGFRKLVNTSQADFLLKTHTITDKKTDVDAFFTMWGYYPYYHPLNWPHRSSATVTREYEIGTLVLDIVDREKKEVVWRGSISRKLGIYSNKSPEERATIALRNAEFLLESFPPSK